MSKKERRSVPVLRFKGFTDDWEQRKLQDISERINRKNEKLESNLPLTISAQYGLVDQKNFFNKQVASKNLKNYILLKKGEFAYNKSYSKDLPYGAIKRLNLYSQGVISSLYIAFKPVNVNSNFLEQYFNSNKWYKEIYRNAAEGARNHGLLNIAPKDFFSSSLNIPSDKTEQKDISNLLFKLDKLLSLQQRKLSLIEKLRENISEHIFSPDIMKFKNIDPEFEIKKLSDISNIFIGLVTTMTKNYAKNGILLIRNSNIKENNFKFDNYIYLDSKFAEKNKNREMKIGDVVTVHTGDIGTSAVIEPKEENSIGFATITTRPNNKIINSYYLSDYLNTKKHKNWAVRMSTGDGRRNYNLKDFTRIRLNVPSLNYQIKIVALIKYLESFSKSEKKKINQLNSLKQFLLQNLFI